MSLPSPQPVFSSTFRVALALRKSSASSSNASSVMASAMGSPWLGVQLSLMSSRLGSVTCPRYRHRHDASTSLVLRGFAVWTVYVWVTRMWNILQDHTKGHGAGFKLVHSVLAVISVAFAVAAWQVVTQIQHRAGERQRPDRTPSLDSAASGLVTLVTLDHLGVTACTTPESPVQQAALLPFRVGLDTEADIQGQREAAAPAARLQELADGHTTTSKPHASSWRPTRGGHDGITTVVPTTTELATNASVSSSSSTSGSGTSASITLTP